MVDETLTCAAAIGWGLLLYGGGFLLHSEDNMRLIADALVLTFITEIDEFLYLGKKRFWSFPDFSTLELSSHVLGTV